MFGKQRSGICYLPYICLKLWYGELFCSLFRTVWGLPKYEIVLMPYFHNLKTGNFSHGSVYLLNQHFKFLLYCLYIYNDWCNLVALLYFTNRYHKGLKIDYDILCFEITISKLQNNSQHFLNVKVVEIGESYLTSLFVVFQL